MAKGFTVKERIFAPPAEVWAVLTNFANADAWMPGVADMKPLDDGPIQVGTRLTFMSRGQIRETRVTAWVPGERMTLTSTQAGVTATYAYTVAPDGPDSSVTLDAQCVAAGLWRFLHPLIVIAMRRADKPQIANLKAEVERRKHAVRP